MVNIEKIIEMGNIEQFGNEFAKLTESERRLVLKKSDENRTDSEFLFFTELFEKHVDTDNLEMIFLQMTILSLIDGLQLEGYVKSLSRERKAKILESIKQSKNNPEWSRLTESESKEYKAMILSSCLSHFRQSSMSAQLLAA